MKFKSINIVIYQFQIQLFSYDSSKKVRNFMCNGYAQLITWDLSNVAGKTKI